MAKHLLITLFLLLGNLTVSASGNVTETRRHHSPHHQSIRAELPHATPSQAAASYTQKGLEDLGGLNPGDLIGGGDLPPGLGSVSQKYKVRCRLIYDESLYYARFINYTGGNGIIKSNGEILPPGTKETEIELEEGTYDFLANFTPWDTNENVPPQSMLDNYAPAHHIMIENITVDSDTELTFNIADACNFIEFAPVNHRGEPFLVGILSFTDEAPGYVWDNTDANVWDVDFYNSFYNTETNEFIYGFMSNYGHRTDDGKGGSSNANLYINNISDRYTLYHNAVAYDGDLNMMWSINLATHADGSKAITNTAGDFRQFTQPISTTKAFGKYPCESHYGSEAEVKINGSPLVEYRFFYDGSDSPTCFMAENNDAGSGFNTSTTAYPRTYDIALYDDRMGEWLKAGIIGCGVTLDNGSLCYINPFSPYFNTTVTPGIEMGANTPVIYCQAQAIDYGMKRPAVYFQPRFIGQNGEERDIDLLETSFDASHNGKTVCSSIEDLYHWIEEFADDSHEDGTVTLKFTDSNIMLGETTATNITEISYTEGQEDLCPPVLQYIRFKQAFPEAYGPRLSTQFSKIEFLAGDMNYNGYETEYSQADVTVEYAPHGSDEFTILENTHPSSTYDNADNGLTLYVTTLMDMNRKSPDGWFDFRFTITDAAGNSTVETLMPAVYIESLHDKSAISDCGSGDINEIEPEYYDLTGRRLAAPCPGTILIEKRGDSISRIIAQ